MPPPVQPLHPRHFLPRIFPHAPRAESINHPELLPFPGSVLWHCAVNEENSLWTSGIVRGKCTKILAALRSSSRKSAMTLELDRIFV